MKTVQEWIDAWGELPFVDPTHDTIGARIYDQQVEQMVRAIQADALEAAALECHAIVEAQRKYIETGPREEMVQSAKLIQLAAAECAEAIRKLKPEQA